MNDMSTSDPFDKGFFAACNSHKELSDLVEEFSRKRKSSSTKLFQEIPFDSKAKRSLKIWNFENGERFTFVKVTTKEKSFLFW